MPLTLDKPYELILAQDLVQQVEKQIGRHHPAYPYVQYYIEVRKERLPTNLRPLVPDDWVWYVSHPFLVLCRLSRIRAVVPVCWVRTSELHRLQIANSDIFTLPPERMEHEFEQISTSWSEAYPTLKAEGVLLIDQPPGLGEWWLDMLEWHAAEPRDQTLFSTAVLPEYRWTPLYRYGDIQKVVSILFKDTQDLSAFGMTPARQMTKLSSELRKKYGVVLPMFRDFSHSRPSLLRSARLAILSRLREGGIETWNQAKKQFDEWFDLSTRILEKEEAYRDARLDEAGYLNFLSHDLKVPGPIVSILKDVLQALGNDQAERIDEVLFRCHEKTLRHAWRSLG